MKLILSSFLIFLIIYIPIISFSDEAEKNEVRVYTYGDGEVEKITLLIDGIEFEPIYKTISINPGYHKFTINLKINDKDYSRTERLFISKGRTDIYIPAFIEEEDPNPYYFLAVPLGIGAGFGIFLLILFISVN